MAAKKKKKVINWGRFRSRLYLLAMIAGILFYIAQYESWFALKGYKIIADSNKIEQRICRCHRQGQMSDVLVINMLSKENFAGRFVTKAEWIKAWVKVNWRGNLWSISRDGKMWLYEEGSKDDQEIIGPVWKISEKDKTQESAGFYGVFKSPLPVEVIEKFLREFQTFQWFNKAAEISYESRAGMNLFILKISNKTQKFELQIQPDKYPDQDVGQTVEEIFEKLISEGGNHIIDATYEGKILLRGL